MTNTPLSTIELEAGFLRRDGNPVAADEIERAARELARTTTMTDVDTSKPEPEIYGLVRELVEHWEVQGATAKKNGDNEVAAQFGMMSRVVKSLYHEARRKSSRCDELERLVVQYRDDLLHPPSEESKERRLAAIAAYQRKGE